MINWIFEIKIKWGCDWKPEVRCIFFNGSSLSSSSSFSFWSLVSPFFNSDLDLFFLFLLVDVSCSSSSTFFSDEFWDWDEFWDDVVGEVWDVCVDGGLVFFHSSLSKH